MKCLRFTLSIVLSFVIGFLVGMKFDEVARSNYAEAAWKQSVTEIAYAVNVLMDEGRSKEAKDALEEYLLKQRKKQDEISAIRELELTLSKARER